MNVVFHIRPINLTSVVNDEPEADVPCGSCTKCCEMLAPFLSPDEVSSGLYPISIVNPNEQHQSTNPEVGPTVTIFKSRSGGCGMLVNKQCSIYDHRPRACKQFDCRKNHHPALTEFAKTYFGKE